MIPKGKGNREFAGVPRLVALSVGSLVPSTLKGEKGHALYIVEYLGQCDTIYTCSAQKRITVVKHGLLVLLCTRPLNHYTKAIIHLKRNTAYHCHSSFIVSLSPALSGSQGQAMLIVQASLTIGRRFGRRLIVPQSHLLSLLHVVFIQRTIPMAQAGNSDMYPVEVNRRVFHQKVVRSTIFYF